MNGISTKLGASSLSGAIVGIGVWVASLFGLDIPGDISVYITVIVGTLVGWAVTETGTLKPTTPDPPTSILSPATTTVTPTPDRPAVDLPTIPQP